MFFTFSNVSADTESAEILLDTLYVFDFNSPRYFQIPIIGGSEPNLKFSVARIADGNETVNGLSSRVF
jgi:hypothetical protein